MPIYTLQREIGRDPRDFSVVADGATDDSAAFAALAAGHYMLSAATYKIGANCTVPVGVHLTMMPGAVFEIATGFTLTINGSFDAPPLQVFSGAGAVKFVKTSPVPEVNILWWGAVADSGTTDNRAAIIAAIESLEGRGGVVLIPNGHGDYFGVSAEMQFLSNSAYSNLTVRGEGWGSWVKHTQLRSDGATVGLFFFQGANSYELKNIRMRDFRVSGFSSSDLMQMLSFDNVDGVVVDHIYFDTNGREGIYFNSPAKVKNVWVTNCYGENIGTTYFGGLSAINLNALNAHCHANTLKNVGQFVEHTGYGLSLVGNNFSGAVNQGLLLMSTWSGWLDANGQEQNSQRVIVADNIIHDSPTGILFGDAGGRVFSGQAVISGNQFILCTNALNIGTDADTPCLVVGNLFYDAPNANNACITLGNGPVVLKGNTFHRGPTAQWAYVVRADSVDEHHTIEDNTVYGLAWTTVAFWFRGTQGVLRNNLIVPHGDSLTGAVLRLGTVDGFQQVVPGSTFTLGRPVTYSGQQRSEWYGSAVPDVFTWKVSDKMENSAAASAGYLEWLCTVAGTAGTLNSGATTGSITTGTAALTLSATTGLYPGAMITIVGVTGAKTITALDYTTKIATLDSNADATVSGAAVAYKAPTFKPAGLIS